MPKTPVVREQLKRVAEYVTGPNTKIVTVRETGTPTAPSFRMELKMVPWDDWNRYRQKAVQLHGKPSQIKAPEIEAQWGRIAFRKTSLLSSITLDIHPKHAATFMQLYREARKRKGTEPVEIQPHIKEIVETLNRRSSEFSLGRGSHTGEGGIRIMLYNNRRQLELRKWLRNLERLPGVTILYQTPSAYVKKASAIIRMPKHDRQAFTVAWKERREQERI